MQRRITISLNQTEYSTLSLLAKGDYRSPRAQLLFLLHQEAHNRGLPMSTEDNQEVSTTTPNDEEIIVHAANR